MSLVAGVFVFAGGIAFLVAQEPPQPAAQPLTYKGQPLAVPVSCGVKDLDAANVFCSDDEPCRLFLELIAVEALGPRILVGGNIHTSSATVSSILLVSDDAGTNWREAAKRVPAAGVEAIQFLDPQQGWVAVQPHGQLAADPYFLATSDGGNRWDKQPIWPEEGRAGLIQQFYFDTKDHGFVLIDRSAAGPGTNRYEMYETMNAGASWMLRETSSRPIATKWSPKKSTDWRLREDAKLRTYELERRAGTSWVRMASFRTQLGECRTPEPEKPAPEAPQPAVLNP